MTNGQYPDAGEQLSTGVAGLDATLGGGLPARRLHLVQGAPGTGKTTLALQFLLAGVRRGERALFVSLSQSRDELEQIASSHGWSLSGVAVEHVSAAQVVEESVGQTVLHTADVELEEVRSAIQRAIRDVRPQRLVYDSLLEVRYLTDNLLRYRRELLAFKYFIAEQRATTLFVDTEPEFGGDKEIEGLAHGIIRLTKALPEYGLARRRLEIKKMRGVAVADGYHDMAIRKGEGLQVFPRVVPALAPEQGGRALVRSSVDRLDEMLGGGLEQGTTTLVVGQAGTGKSTLSTLYARAALERGEEVAMFLFEERLETFFRRCEGLGMDLRRHHSTGRLHLADFNPAEVSPGEFSLIVRRMVDECRTRVVVIDSFTGYLTTLPHRDEAVMQMQSLLKYLSRRGVLTILVVAQHGLLGDNVDVPVDVSFVGDTVLLLRMFETASAVRRTITVAKKRHGPHDLDIRRLNITSAGVDIEDLPPRAYGDGSG